MNMLLLAGLDEEQKEKYLLLKEAQELLYQIVCYKIREKAHTQESQCLYEKIAALDASVELVEISVENATNCLDAMTKGELTEMLEDDRDLYKKEVLPPH